MHTQVLNLTSPFLAAPPYANGLTRFSLLLSSSGKLGSYIKVRPTSGAGDTQENLTGSHCPVPCRTVGIIFTKYKTSTLSIRIRNFYHTSDVIIWITGGFRRTSRIKRAAIEPRRLLLQQGQQLGNWNLNGSRRAREVAQCLRGVDLPEHPSWIASTHMVVCNHLEHQSRGIWCPLLDSSRTASTQCTDVKMKYRQT